MADFKVKYAASADIDIDPEGLATSATRTAGVESAEIDNGTNLFLDALVEGRVRTGTSPTGGQIDIWIWGTGEATGGAPDVIDGTKSAETITSENVRNAALRLAASIPVDTTSDRDYFLAPVSVAQLFGGLMPRRWGVFLAHNTGVALNATGTNHVFRYAGIHQQSV